MFVCKQVGQMLHINLPQGLIMDYTRHIRNNQATFWHVPQLSYVEDKLTVSSGLAEAGDENVSYQRWKVLYFTLYQC